MKHNLYILTTVAVLAMPGLAFSQPASLTMQANEKISQYDRDAYRDRSDISDDNARIRQQELDVKKDRAKMRMERSEGDTSDAARERKEISKDNARIREEERDVKKDRSNMRMNHREKHHRHHKSPNGQEHREGMGEDRDRE